MRDIRLVNLQIELINLARHIADGKLDGMPGVILARFEPAVAVMKAWVEDPHSQGQVRAAFPRDAGRQPMLPDEAVLAALLERVGSGYTTFSDRKLLEDIIEEVAYIATTRSGDCAVCGRGEGAQECPV